jgi:DnaJ-class molecular chaperone
MPRTQPCGTCHGGGTVLVPVSREGKEEGLELVPQTCGGCGGKGTIEVPDDDDDDDGRSGGRRG